jgi:hypothetical protein
MQAAITAFGASPACWGHVYRGQASLGDPSHTLRQRKARASEVERVDGALAQPGSEGSSLNFHSISIHHLFK